MPQDEEGEGKQQEPKHDTTPSPQLTPPPEQGKGATANNPEDDHQLPNEKQEPTKWRRFWGFLTKSEWVMAFLTGVIAATGVVGIILIVKSGADTKTLITAASNIEHDLSTMNSQNFKALAQTLSQSNSAFTATVNQFHLEQRAWVGPVAMVEPQFDQGSKRVFIKDGYPTKFSFLIMNLGKTPAKNIHIRIADIVLPSSQPFAPVYPKTSPTLPTVGVLLPAVRSPIHTVQSQGNATATSAQIATLNSGKWIFYYFRRDNLPR